MNLPRATDRFLLSSDADVVRAIDDLKAERDRYRRQLEFIARYHPREGYRAAYFAVILYARTCLYGSMSPWDWHKQKRTLGTPP